MDPESVFKDGNHPTPSAEVEFWSAKAQNLNAVAEQLSSERVRKAPVCEDQLGCRGPGARGNGGIMRDHGNGQSFAVLGGDQVKNFAASARVKISSWLIRQKHAWLIGQRARDGQALALARGQTPQDSCSHGVQAAALGHQPLQLHKGKGIQGDRVCDRRERAGRDAQGSEVGGERV
jgi:hypothetical protein